MPKTINISTGMTASRWTKLVEYVQHSTSVAVRCVFEDAESAKTAHKSINANIERMTGNIPLVAFRSGQYIYMVKVNQVDVAVIHDSVRGIMDSIPDRK